MMKRNANEVPNDPALKSKDPKTGKESVWTWSAYHQETRTVAKAFIDLGLEKYGSVCILGFNSPEWIISDVAAIFAGGFATGIYPTNGSDACKYILEHSRCNILVVEDQKQLDKIWSFKNDLPNLKKIDQYTGLPNSPGVISWKDLLNRGNSLDDASLESRLRGIAINQCSTLVYTSGTTGNPKGGMLSHDNIVWTSKVAIRNYGLEKRNFRVLSYLPLSHVAGQMFDIHAPIILQGCTYFADKNVMKGSLIDNLQWCRPTAFLGVPRVWEKVMEKMLEKAREIKGLKKKISREAKKVGLKCNTEDKQTTMFKVFQKIYYTKVKTLLGLDHCNLFVTGAAPISREVVDYFMSLDIKLTEFYGMSESTGYHTGNLPGKIKFGSVGVNTDITVKSKLVKSDDAEVTDAKELCMWGRHVMMGYVYREDATRKDMSEDGWLKTGDLVDIANREAVSNAQKIQKWMVLPRDFSIPGGEIGPTMKVKRQAVTKMYQKQIEKIYA